MSKIKRSISIQKDNETILRVTVSGDSNFVIQTLEKFGETVFNWIDTGKTFRNEIVKFPFLDKSRKAGEVR